MSDMRSHGRRRGPLLLKTLICWTLIGLCSAGHRPYERWERTRHPRQHDRWAQRIVFPSLNDQTGHYTGVNDGGQIVQFPSMNDDSSQVQKCAPGFYRDGSGPYLGLCVPCECNGRADECEDRTGRCLNCQFNTAGDKCERCKEGYYGDATQRTCRICPCPFSLTSNSFAVGCREVFGDVQCICKLGYSGGKCERCAPGYYGDPLIPGGSCQPCNCNGNGNTCDSRTGVCKNTQEPGDTGTDDHCKECDSCAQTLLNDLEKLDDDLNSIKSQLDNATVSTTSKDRLAKLEKSVADTKVLVNKYSAAISAERSRVKQLEVDVSSLSDDIVTLDQKADKRATETTTALAEVEKTHKRAKALDAEIKNLLKKIQALLDQLKEGDTSGDSVTSESLAKMMEEAERMVKEMENKDFDPQKTAAEKERDEAEKLLEHIKTNVTKQCTENEAAVEKLQQHLKDHEAKLKDLEKALKEANDSLKKATTENNLSAQALKDLQKRVKNLKEEKKTVEDQMALAQDELKKAKDLAKKLTDSKMEYEQLAAQLDGAKTDLAKKVKEISEAAAKENLVQAAEDHAEELLKLAKELENAVKNASGATTVRDAKNAIDAYKNITDAINAADAAAKEAKAAAENALNNVKNQKLTERAKDLKETGDDLLQNAKDANGTLQDATKELNDLKKRLKDAQKKKATLEKALLDAKKELNNTKRDDIENMINEAKRKAAAANDSTANTMNRLNDIKKEIDKISLSPVDSNLGNILDNVDKSVKDLLTKIPTLNDKISEVENLTSNFSPITNISENIKKIKDLIEQARDAANRISIPMKFKGDGHVELRPPKDLEDLKAYTALSLSLQRPQSRGDGRRRRRQTREKADMFVMYLGNRDPSKNYIGMALRDNVLYGVYKLNGVEYEMETGYITKSASEPAKFDRVDLSRIYQDAELTLVKDITSSTPGEPIQKNNQGEESKNLLDLTPNDIVFYVGGYPANFTPPAPLNYPMYEGCIEFNSFNDRGISLYNFQNKNRVNVETPCKRYVPPEDAQYFEGSGYSKVLIDKTSNVLLISMSIYARSESGLLLFLENLDNYFAVTVESGVITIHSSLLTAPVKGKEKTFPRDDWVSILVIITNKGKFTVRVANSNVAEATAKFTNEGFKEFYVGGAPADMRERHNITMQPLKACMKNLQLNKDFKPADEQVGVSRGCPQKSLIPRRAELGAGGSLSSDLSGFSLAGDVTVSLGFKSSQNQGLLLQNKQPTDGIKLALDNGHVVLSLNNKIWKSKKRYQDGKWHYLTVTRRAGRTELVIDDEDRGQEQSGAASVADTAGSLVLGEFQGCVSNLYTRRPESLFMAEDLSLFRESGDVLLDSCTPDNPAQLMVDRVSKKEVLMSAVNESMSACALPATVQHAYRMGGPVSSLSYSLPLQVLLPRPHFSLEVRTRSPEGLLFFATTRGGRYHLALYMSKGRIRLSTGKEKEIFNREKYNDGKWHSVIFSLEKKKFRLVVDGIRALDGQLTHSESTSMQHFMPPVYLGSVPEALHKQLKSKGLPKHSVSGCIRNFKMNGALMTSPATNLGAGPCFEGQPQRGAYFSGNGAHVVINESFNVGSSFEVLLSIRPRSPTGLLLHVSDSSRTQHGPSTGRYISVYLHDGQVVAQVNNGNGNFMVSVKPKASLCDGMFHKVSVIKRKNVVQLHVDTVDNYKIGPPVSSVTLTKDTLYVGGIPDTLMLPALPVSSSFVGCIQDMKINEESVSFERLSAVSGPVNLRECPS